MADAAPGWEDALPSVAPTPAMLLGTAAPPAPSPPAATQPNYRIDWDPKTLTGKRTDLPSSAPAPWEDSLPSVAPTPAMQLADQPPQARGSTWGGIRRSALAGAETAGWDTLAALPDMANRIANLPIRGINAATGASIPEFSTDLGGQASRALAHATGGFSPTEMQPQGGPERMAYAAGNAVGSLPGMALGGAGLGAVAPLAAGAAPALAGAARTAGMAGQSIADMPIARSAAPVAAGAAGGQAAEDAAPPPLKPYVNLLGNLAVGGLGGLAQEGAAAGLRQLGNRAGMMGVGSKETIAGLPVTGTQADAAARQVDQALGPQGRQMLVNAPEELVPGSQPTTAQVAPTPGAVALDQAARLASPQAFIERAQAQNNARVAAVQGTAPPVNAADVAQGAAPIEANAAAPGALFRQQLEALDAQGAQATGQARAGVAAATDAIGGRTSPQASGQAIRGALQGVYDEQHPGVSALWQAVDPEGNLALSISPIKEAASKLLAEVNPNLGDALNPQEHAILNGAAGLSDVVPFQNVQRLRTNIGNTQGALRAEPGNDQSLRRLGILKSAVDQSIEEGVNAVASQNPEMLDRVRSAIGNIVDQQTQAGGVASEGVNGSSPGASESGSSGGRGPTGTAIPQGGRPGGVARNPGVAPAAQPPLTPNFTPEAADRYAAARAATLAEKQTFRTGVVGDVLQGGRRGVPHKIADSDVAARFLSSGPRQAEDVAKYIAAVRGRSNAIGALREALVSELRAAAIQPDGTLDRDAFARWQKRRSPAIELFPELKPQFKSMQAAQQAYDDAAFAHAQSVKEFQKGAAQHFLTDDPIKAVGKAFASANPTETFTRLTQMVRGNAEAEAGLRRAVTDFILEKMSTATPSGPSDIDFLKSDTLRRWVRTNARPLRILYGGQGMQNLEAVAADLRRQTQRTAVTPGSDTAQKYLAAKKSGFGLKEGAHLTALAVIGDQIGEMAAHATGAHGALALMAGPLAAGGGYLLHALRQKGIDTVHELVTQAMLHPAVGRELLQRIPENGRLSPMLQRRIAAALLTSAAAQQHESRH